MSESEEDFASADEGEVESTSAGTPKMQPKETELAVAKVVQEQKEENKIVGTSDTVEVASKSGMSIKDNVPKQRKQNSKKSEKEAKSPLGKECQKEVTKPKAATNKSCADEKSQQKPRTDRGKKGNKKGGKSKTVQSENELSSNSKDIDKNTDNKKTDDSSEGAAVEVRNEEIVGSSDKVWRTEADEAINIETKNENRKEKETESENSKEVELEKRVNVTATPSGNDMDLENKPLKELNKEMITDSPESLTLEQKVDMIKSPSSQSITRPDPDHTEKQDAVLDKLAEAAKDTKSGWGWGWGSSLLEVASSSVSTFTSQVGEGLHTMIETVESTLNVPNPEELAEQVGKQTEEVAERRAAHSGDLALTVGGETEFSNELITENPAENVAKELKNDGEPTQIDDSRDKGNQSVKPEETVDLTKSTENKQTILSSRSEKTVDNQSGDGWFSAWGVSNITKMVENTGKSLVTGSLDVLETLGKKTFDVINEHDPGLKKARGFLHDRRDKPNLSAMLRDAKEQHESQAEQEKELEEACKAHFGSLFDDFQGLAHLEALEMLSNQSEKKVNALLNALPAEAIAELKPHLLEIKHNFEITDEEEDVSEQDFAPSVTDLLKELNVGTTPDKLIRTRDSIKGKLTEFCDAENKQAIKGIHQAAISSLAQFTSKCIEQFHKSGEMILIQTSAVTNLPACSYNLLRLTKVLTAEVGILSNQFLECLNKQEGDDELKVNQLVTNIYLEASNSSSYIQDGFQLLLPVLQQAAIARSQEPES